MATVITYGKALELVDTFITLEGYTGIVDSEKEIVAKFFVATHATYERNYDAMASAFGHLQDLRAEVNVA